MDITTARPAEIDTEIAALQSTARAFRATLHDYSDFLHRALGDKRNRHGFWDTTLDDAISRATEAPDTISRSYRGGVASALDEIPAVRALLVRNEAEQAPLHEEYVRRGRWTRAFLCTNAGGHIHSSQGCSTLRASTSLVWIITADGREVSGMTEAEVVELAGEKACTVCYPTAPCVGLCRIEDPEVAAAKKVRDDRKAELAAQRAAKGIVDPETGGELRIVVRGRRETIRTERAAMIELVDQMSWREFAQQRGNYDGDREQAIEKLAEALAAKQQSTVGIVITEAEVRLIKRNQREARR